MNDTIETLINGYLDEVLTDQQRQQLEAWINADPANARRFAETVYLDNRLRAELTAAQFAPQLAQDTLTPNIAPTKTSRRWLVGAALAVSLCLLLALNLWWAGRENPQETPSLTAFASVSRVVEPVWTGERSLQVGDRLAKDRIRLERGMLRLLFDDGVEVTLEGPVEFQLLDTGRTRLMAGVLTATVPPGAEGFRVETPTGEVVDLGTAFGVHVEDDGVADVHVFDGEVEVVSSRRTQKRRLVEGESIRFLQDDRFESADFDASRFAKLWPLSSGIAGSSGAFRFVPPWPKRLRLVRSNDDVFVAPEGYATRLASPLRLNIARPGKYADLAELTPLELDNGQRVRSYILHYHPEETVPPRRAKRITGTITFDRPVLGLIVRHEELVASSRQFRRRAAGEAQPRRQLELTGDARGDIVSLSPDRRTVSVDLISPGRSSDLIRVIMDAESPGSPRKN